MPKILEGSWGLNYHVATVATLKVQQADVLLFGRVGRDDCWDMWTTYEPRDLFVVIDYPLEEAVEVTVTPKDYGVHGYPSLGAFLLTIAKKYEMIYKNPRKYGIWGHGIEDLYFERVSIKRDGMVELFIGS